MMTGNPSENLINEVPASISPPQSPITAAGSSSSSSVLSASSSLLKWSTQNWMGDLSSILSTRPLASLSLPGTHQSASYSIKEDSPNTNEELDLSSFAALAGPALIDNIVYRLAVCQTKTICEQLNSGIRYLDFRMILHLDELRICHSKAGQKIETLLTEISDWLQNHPKEIIIIDFQKLYKMTSEDISKLRDIIKERFGDSLLSSNSSLTLTSPLADFWEQKIQVLVIGIEGIGLGINQIARYWPNSNDPSRITKYLSEKLMESHNETAQRQIPTKLFVLQAIMTPTPQDVFGCVLNPTASLASMAAKLIPTITDFITKGPFSEKRGGIFIVDFFEAIPEFSQSVIELNLKS